MNERLQGRKRRRKPSLSPSVWQPPPGATWSEEGSILNWPVSGLSEGEKIAQAVEIAVARREGRPYHTKSGVNLGADSVEQAAEWPKSPKKTTKATKSAPPTLAPTIRLTAKGLQAQIRRVQGMLKVLTEMQAALPNKKTSPAARPKKPPRSKQLDLLAMLPSTP